jgi:hypothetical protein
VRYRLDLRALQPLRSDRIGVCLAAACLLAASVAARADAPPDRYLINSSQGLVTDLRTGLVGNRLRAQRSTPGARQARTAVA